MHLQVARAIVLSLSNWRACKLALLKRSSQEDSKLLKAIFSPLFCIFSSFSVKRFTDRSKVVLLLWIIYVISAMFCYASRHVCLLMPCGRLLGKGWPLSSRLWCLIETLSLSHRYPGSGVVLDCYDSWSLPLSFLVLLFLQKCQTIEQQKKLDLINDLNTSSLVAIFTKEFTNPWQYI